MANRMNEWDRNRIRNRQDDQRFRYAADRPDARGSDYGDRPEDFARYGRRPYRGPWDMEDYYQQRDPWGSEYMGEADFGWGGDYGYERAGSLGLGEQQPSRPDRPVERDWRAAIGRPWRYDTESWMVPGPFIGQGPTDYRRSADRIREDVCERLTQYGYLDARNIQVEVDESTGEVTLNGTVDSRRSKRMAEDVAESVTGVRDVHNRLRIEPQQEG